MAEFNWDRLLRRIDDGAVVPVIGQELLRQDVDGKTVSLGGLIAQRLAKSLEIEIEPQPFFELSDVVSSYLARPGTVPSELYQDIAWIYKEITRTLPVPAALTQLAAFGKFDLFVNLGFDSMLACALNRARFAGAPGTREIAFSMNQSTDSQEQALKPPPEGTPVVFNLFGRASSTDDYVIHDEDALEFIHRLVSGDVEPPQWLLSRLRSADLLVLGVHLPDWLGRFVLRAATRDRLGLSRRGYFIARENAAQAATLDEFLRRFGRETRIHVYDGAAEGFVDELARRWQQAYGAQPASAAPAPAPGGDSRWIDLHQLRPRKPCGSHAPARADQWPRWRCVVRSRRVDAGRTVGAHDSAPDPEGCQALHPGRIHAHRRTREEHRRGLCVQGMAAGDQSRRRDRRTQIHHSCRHRCQLFRDAAAVSAAA